jgi:hypothetical protein
MTATFFQLFSMIWLPVIQMIWLPIALPIGRSLPYSLMDHLGNKSRFGTRNFRNLALLSIWRQTVARFGQRSAWDVAGGLTLIDPWN